MNDRLDESIKDYLGQTRELPAGLGQKAKDLMPGPGPGAARCPHCGKPIAPPKKPLSSDWNLLWLAAAAAAFAASFALPDYFFQALAVALVCAFKWLIDYRARKTQILIYKAMSGEEKDAPGHRLHRHTSRL